MGISELEIKILNWEKYQFRKQVKNPSWFRLENRMWNDQQFFYFTAEERWIWICLLSIASEKQCATIKVSVEWLSQDSRVGRKTLLDSLEKLKQNNCLEYTLHERNTQVPLCIPTRQDKTEHNKTRQDKTKTICVEPKQVLVASPTVSKKDLSFFINEKLLELYPQEYIDREKVKMQLWLATNSHKKPKSERGMVRFVTGWLSRGWEQYRRGLQSNAPKERGIADILADEEQ